MILRYLPVFTVGWMVVPFTEIKSPGERSRAGLDKNHLWDLRKTQEGCHIGN
jgi:hypothetical protein